MLFNSISFLLFFLFFFQCYWLLNNKSSVKIRNLFILVCSYFFYGCWDWRFLGLIILSSVVDYSLGLQMAKSATKESRKILLIVSLIFNLGILGFFKYFNFFISSFQDLLVLFQIPLNTYTLSIILPVGVSFYTFQSLSYTIDIYRDRMKPEQSLLSFLTFVAFFPQLVAGPIERATHLLKQFDAKKQFNYASCISGLRLVLWGLFKKVVLADNIAQLVDLIFNPSLNPEGGITLLGGVLFAFQIYCDFSGYSDIAVGLSKLLGFDLMRNFQAPYCSTSMTEFWRRWHISLSTWFKDYVYIPLGGNEKGAFRTALNLFITFLLSGLWHGAKFTFVLWGTLHGLILIVERFIKVKFNEYLKVVLVFLVSSLLWIPFRAENFQHLKSLFFSFKNFKGSLVQFNEYLLPVLSPIKLMAVLFSLLLFLLIDRKLKVLDFDQWIQNKNKTIRIVVYYWLMVSIILLGNINSKPSFIYFQF